MRKKRAKIIIGIHGLRNKPPRRILKRWWKKAIKEGLRTAGHRRTFFRFELVYWADILHHKPLRPREKNPDHPRYLESPYIPAKDHKTHKPSRLRRRVLDLLEKQLDKLFLKEDLSFDLSGITDKIITRYFEDLDTYYNETPVVKRGKKASARELIMQRLSRTLTKHRRKHILLIAHSMGSIIAFDVMMPSERDYSIHTFITVGSPLGIPAVIKKSLSGQKKPEQKARTPDCIVHEWLNYTDLKDRVAFNYNLKDDYGPNRHGIRPVDHAVYNNYENNGKRNPHKSYGYLRTPELSRKIYAFLKERPGRSTRNAGSEST